MEWDWMTCATGSVLRHAGFSSTARRTLCRLEALSRFATGSVRHATDTASAAQALFRGMSTPYKARLWPCVGCWGDLPAGTNSET